ncbi:diguanylate cyclase [Permianibacter sp. IMCC34836]|uniref:diguanylate cyclase domain-containing protein n=1 Tax=Permianibacter fluminis TaxID=2738515 RepID=UPI001557BE44|nr:diguanylate cyclase [Permianibacter fluminis]NQD35464.1 diguanylate cyclase [Permianibacter fluminis]
MSTETDQQKAELRRLFARRLPGKLRQIAGYVQRLQTGEALTGLGGQLVVQLEHSIRSCESFGFAACARLLQQVENQCLNPEPANYAPLIQALAHLAEELDGKPSLAPAEPQATQMEAPATDNLALQPLWLALPEQERTMLAGQLALFGFAASTVPQDGGAPVALVAEANEVGDLRARYGDQLPPLIVVADDDQITARLLAIRQGAAAFLARPLDTAALIEAIDEVSPASAGEPPRVLIVEDSKSQSMHYNKVLKEAGCSTAVVNQPLKILEALHALQPELILLDMQMPECTGLELARVLRQMPGWRTVPVLFMSAEENPEKQAAAMAVSGDDFLLKPVRADELKKAVLTRIARSRMQLAQLNRDGLTGLLNLSAMAQAIDNQCAQASRTGEPLCFAQLDIDRLGPLNESAGHGAGDAVVRQLARLLGRRLRKSDTIGRLGGDRFGVLLPGCRGDDALRLIDAVRSDLAKHPLLHGGHTLAVKLSAGVAQHDGGAPGALRDAAEKALQWAKDAGGNSARLAS